MTFLSFDRFGQSIYQHHGIEMNFIINIEAMTLLIRGHNTVTWGDPRGRRVIFLFLKLSFQCRHYGIRTVQMNLMRKNVWCFDLCIHLYVENT